MEKGNFACVNQGNVNFMRGAKGQQLVSIANLRQKHPLQRGKVSQFKIIIHDLKFLLNILFNICCVVKCWPELSSNTALMISILIKHETFRYSMFLF